MSKILIVDDDKEIASLIGDSLYDEGYETLLAYDGEIALEKVSNNLDLEMIILDIMMPKVDGLEVCRKIREKVSCPIIFVSAKSRTLDTVLGLEIGADDYITKPFNVEIAMQRINAVLRRVEGIAKTSVYVCGNLYIDFDTHMVKKSGEIIHLTPTEYKLLYTFVKNPNIALTRSLLLEKLWDNEGNFVDEHTLTINISRLKSKISDDQYTYIKTIYGMGYQWIGDSND